MTVTVNTERADITVAVSHVPDREIVCPPSYNQVQQTLYCQGQAVKIVYTLQFEPVVQSRSILGLGLPSSANGNCEGPLAVYWNCLFVSNQGVFTVSRVSGRSALSYGCSMKLEMRGKSYRIAHSMT